MATTIDTLLVRIEADMSDLRRDLSKVAKHTDEAGSKMKSAFAGVAKAAAALGGVALFSGFIKSSIQTGAAIEGLRVQLNGLLGSVDEGGKAFEMMTAFASKVPFSLDQIQSGSGSLAAAADNADELGELMQITGNIAAQFNIPFEMAAENVQRALSAGAASADLFQQKGVNAFMGLKAGVSVSAEDTAKVLIEHFGTGGTSDGAMAEFAKTTNGALSMFGDAMFNFRKKVAQSGLNQGFTDLINVITGMINNSGDLATLIGDKVGKAFSALGRVLTFIADISGEVAMLFRSIYQVAATAGSILMQMFGFELVDLMDAVAGAILLIKENMDKVIVVVGVFVAYKFAAKLFTAAEGAIKLARGLRAIGITQAILNSVTKKGIGTWLVIAAIFGEITGATDGLKDRLASFASDVYERLPEDLKGSIGDVSEYFGKSAEAIDEARQKLFQTGSGFVMLNPGESVALDVDATIEGIQNALMGAGVAATVTDGEFKKLKTTIEGLLPEEIKLLQTIEAIEKALPRMDEALKAQALDAIAILKQELLELDPLYKQLTDRANQAFDTMADSLTDMVMRGKIDLQSLGSMFKQTVNEMIADALKAQIIKPVLGGIFGAIGSAIGGPVGGFIGKIAGDAIGGSADGGNLNANMPQIVGERGPELIVPKSASNIMNNHNTKNALGSGGGTIIQQTINVSAGVSQTVKAEMISLMPRFKQEAMRGVVDAKRRGGSYGQAFG